MSTYAIVDTGQTSYYGSTTTISTPSSTAAFYGQDASYQGLQPSYTDNNNGTVTDRNTGLTWMKSVTSQEMTWEQAVAYADSAVIGGYDDWRLPSVKGLDSLIQFTGNTAQTASASLWDASATTRSSSPGTSNMIFGLISAQFGTPL